MRKLLTAADLSPAQARTANATRPMAAARIAAAPEPFVRAAVFGELVLSGLFIFLLPGVNELCDRPGPEHTCQSWRRRSPRYRPQQTKSQQSRAPRPVAADGA